MFDWKAWMSTKWNAEQKMCDSCEVFAVVFHFADTSALVTTHDATAECARTLACSCGALLPGLSYATKPALRHSIRLHLCCFCWSTHYSLLSTKRSIGPPSSVCWVVSGIQGIAISWRQYRLFGNYVVLVLLVEIRCHLLLTPINQPIFVNLFSVLAAYKSHSNHAPHACARRMS